GDSVGEARKPSRGRPMWNWLQSLRSWFEGTVEQTGERPRPEAIPVRLERAVPSLPSLPGPEKPPPALAWNPCERPALEEPALAPPLSPTPADQEPILGIDLGTSHSVVAVVRDGKVEVIPNQEGEYLTPSVVAFTDDGRVLVGSPAVRQAALNPHRTLYSVKPHLARLAAS